MSPLRLVYYPDEILREKTAPVTEFSAELHQFLDNMLETMYHENGVGLAAPQVADNRRITVIDTSPDGNEPREFINPVIVSKSGKKDSEEGCLSIPEYRDTVSRAETVVVEAYDRNGEKFTLEADELLAVCLQHEIDHLDGILFVDHLSKIKRDMFKKKYKKMIEQGLI